MKAKLYLLEMCTGSVVENDKGESIAPKGTKCVSPCIFRADYYGASFCWTNLTDWMNNEGYGWGAECVPCSGRFSKYYQTLVLGPDLNSYRLIIELMKIITLGQCVPYSAQACINAAQRLGLTISSISATGYNFAGDYGTKGCYSYHKGDDKGVVYYGTNGENEEPPTPPEIKSSLDHTDDQYRPQGFDCVEGLHLTSVILSTSLI